jgi:hypothetical protein
MSRSLLRLVAGLSAIGLLAGCAGAGGMVKADAPTLATPTQATVVFMRSSFLGAAISASVFDVTQDPPRLVGIVQTGTKVAYPVTPGEHVFMVVSEAADFMKADVATGKTYYALVTPRMGAWKARFSFHPLRQADFAGPDFAGWDADTHWVQAGPEAESWADRNMPDIVAKRAEYWPRWQAKEQIQRDSQTLKAEDGR